MAKKVSYEEFVKRFKTAHPEYKVKFSGYRGIIHPITIECLSCGKKHYYKTCNRAISGYRCCDNKDTKRIDEVRKWLDDQKDFSFVKQLNSEDIVIRHNVCGNTCKKNIQKFFHSPDSCNFCNTKGSKSSISLYDAQKILDDLFLEGIELLEYNGRHEKCKYRCQKCNQIFSQKFDCLLASAGCPKCDKQISQGEKKFEKLLQQNGFLYKKQIEVPELPRQRFDFGVYDNNEQLLYYVEIQDEQHYQPVPYWGGEEKYQKIVERDNRKRKYCLDNNIVLYEIKYFNKKFFNLDILPFSSTTIPVKGSTT